MTKYPNEQTIYKEWQLPRFTSFIANALVFPAFWLVLAPINADLGLILGIVSTLVSIAIRFALSKRILVTAESIFVGKAKIPRKVLGTATVIQEDDQFAERGPRLDSRAFVAFKALQGLVKVENKDPLDPTPYLLISTRRPFQLKDALEN